MIAKISSSNNLYGALAYNQTKVDKEKGKVIFASKMIENTDGNFDMRTCLQSFESYISANKRTKKPVLHISINPDPKDKLTDEQLSDIAQTYMQKMGYGDQPFIVYKHEDIERKHIHIVSLRVDENGKKIDHNFERRRSMGVCRELEQKYGLVAADKKQRQDVLPLKKIDYEKGDVKHQMANVIRPIAGQWYFQSFQDYKTLLSVYNIGVEEVKTSRGELYGDFRDLEVRSEVTGLVYSALNEKGEKVGTPLKSSLFGKEAGLESLKQHYLKSKETIKEKGLKQRSKTVISEVLQTCKTRTELEKALEQKNISVLFRTAADGRIYGATFIDHQQRSIFNGSDLGKEYSARVFDNLFNGRENTFKPYEKKEFEPFEKSQKEFGENSNSGGIFDLFSSNSGSDIADEIAEHDLIHRLKKKKKQQRRHL